MAAAGDEAGGKVFYLSAIGSPEEALEKNQKKLDKARQKAGGGNFEEATHLYTSLPSEKRALVPCPNENCNRAGTLTEPRAFNLMFKTYVGALEEASSVAYLRPETAQGIFANFKNVCDTGRVRLPFGSARRWARVSATRSPRATSRFGRVSLSRWRSSSSALPRSRSIGTGTGGRHGFSGMSTMGY